MLIKITNQCSMGCSHCCDDCLPVGEMMTPQTFDGVLSFVRRTRPKVIVVSGGEPTEHPHLLSMIDRLHQSQPQKSMMILTTNGLFLKDKVLADAILSRHAFLSVQITNDARFYPTPVPTRHHKAITYERQIRQCLSIGRAKANGLSHGEVKGTKCFNFLAITRQTKLVNLAILQLENLGRFCTPLVKVNGDISPGEFEICPSIGNVHQDLMDLNLATLKFDFEKCNQCGYVGYISIDKRRQFSKL